MELSGDVFIGKVGSIVENSLVGGYVVVADDVDVAFLCITGSETCPWRRLMSEEFGHCNVSCATLCHV